MSKPERGRVRKERRRPPPSTTSPTVLAEQQSTHPYDHRKWGSSRGERSIAVNIREQEKQSRYPVPSVLVL